MLTHRGYLPILTWGAENSWRTFTNDLIVAGIVTIMLIPHSLAYALLAGLPALDLALWSTTLNAKRVAGAALKAATS